MCVKLSWNKFKHVAEACTLDVRALFDDDDRSYCLSAINKWKKKKKNVYIRTILRLVGMNKYN